MIAYDSNVLIYFIEGDQEFADASRKIVELGEQQGAVLSVLVWQEVLTGVALRQPALVEEISRLLQSFQVTRYRPVTSELSRLAAELTGKYGRSLKGYDAIHLATAIEHGADVFYTNDNRLVDLGMTEIAVRGLA